MTVNIATRGATTDTEDEAELRSVMARIAHDCTIAGEASGHERCWQALGQAGVTQLRHPDDDGIPIAPTSTSLLVIEELGRVLCGAPILSAGAVVPDALRHGGAGSDAVEQVCGMAPGLALDSSLGSPGTGADDDLGWDARFASTALTLDGGQLALVGVGAEQQLADRTRTVRALVGVPEALDVRLPAEAIERVHAFARLAVTADSLGAAGGLLDAAVGYAHERTQFDVAIGSFQAVQHLLATAFAQLEALRSSLLYAAWALDGGDLAGAPHAARVAKAFAAVVTTDAVHAAAQVFGGIGATWEHPTHRHLRRVLVDRLVFGNDDDLQCSLARKAY